MALASLEKELHKIVSDWISRNSNRTSLITITNLAWSSDEKYVTFCVSVLPENQEPAVLDFLTRNKDTIRDYVKKHGKLHHIPFFKFSGDVGEKNRQKVFELLAE